MLPEDWLKKYAPLAGMGAEADGTLRFTRAQVGLLDALLAAQPEVAFDERLRRGPATSFARFAGVRARRSRPNRSPASFASTSAKGSAGCTSSNASASAAASPTTWAWARPCRCWRCWKRGARRDQAGASAPRPSLVVVPRSLVFNWRQEAARFTPELRVLDHTGIARGRDAAAFADVDLILTTYGTLRRDILMLKDIEFDYCILDEAQAIKNAGSESAKAVRLLRGRSSPGAQRHAGGEPSRRAVEPVRVPQPRHARRRLGASSCGGGLAQPRRRGPAAAGPRPSPFILRRTKEQVAKELPAKTEQTLYCELEPEQRKMYDELRDHYRQALLQRVETRGEKSFKIQVLEALLRLRQAACHPGLIARTKADESSAKLDVLLAATRAKWPREGTRRWSSRSSPAFLGIVRKRLDAEGIAYEYLDGRTRDRQAARGALPERSRSASCS